ncbi:MAG: VOC family protein [Eubacterium sp.]|nr:VOC family protein [Eubacterium sp.]
MKLDHFTINVTDLEASRKFYGEVLGLEALPTVDMGDHELWYFSLGGGAMLELILYKDRQPELHPAVKTKGIYRHFALAVDDLDALYEKLTAAGTRILQEPAYVPNLKFRNILIEDPNGVEIEIVERDK